MNLEIINLFKKHYHNQCSPEELVRVMELFAAGTFMKEWDYILMEESQNVMQGKDQAEMSAVEVSALHERIIHTIGQHQPKTVQLYKKKSAWNRIAVAAAILLVASVGMYFYTNKQYKNEQNEQAYQNDIAPGETGATLTLANGQKILIKDALAGNIAEQAGVRISKTTNGQLIYELVDNEQGGLAYNTLSTTRGEQIQVRLPDGTLVFLNAESSLSYPTRFAKQGNREVSLSGEGYFEVSKDRLHPFIVKTARQNVQVLGTHFNIKAYDDEATTTTTLLEGSVRVSNTKLDQKVLQPGEQAIMGTKGIQVSQADVEEATDWKNGEFIFSGADFRTVMREVERWYNIEVIYEPSAPINLQLGGFCSRSRNISSVLKSIAKTDEVHFRIQGRKVFVSK